MSRKVLVVANGDFGYSTLVENLLEQADLVIACDGAANRLEKCDIVIGDLDSISVENYTELIHDESAMESDLTKALKGFPDATDIVGISGGRPDHVLGCMLSIVESKSRAIAHLDGWTLSYADREMKFELPAGKILSLFAIGKCEGVSITGAKYELENETMYSGTRGLHNEGMDKEVIISVITGDLLVFIES